jgi:nicotinic acid phosphoribosyltransferase
MFARKGLFSSIGRTTALATVAALALAAIEPSLAVAAPALKEKGLTAATGTSDVTDFSARRRYYRGGGGAAAAALFAGIVGTGIAIAAANSRRDYYDSYGYYGGAPAYYGGVPRYRGYPGW